MLTIVGGRMVNRRQPILKPAGGSPYDMKRPLFYLNFAASEFDIGRDVDDNIDTRTRQSIDERHPQIQRRDQKQTAGERIN